jgi:uncharacterized protein (DUF1800 family)
MKSLIKLFYTGFMVMVTGVLLCSFLLQPPAHTAAFSFPYKKAGLTERQAAAHLLSRFTYGATPGDVDKVVKTGLEKWFAQQLEAGLPDDTLTQLLGEYDALNLTNVVVANTFPKNAQVLRMAIRDGYLDKDSVNNGNRQKYRDQIATYMKDKGLRPQAELYRQFYNQKILRATYTNNQLQEVLTDFWFNHFNVSMTKNDCAEFIPAYERDVIRPNALGNFENILLATAKSPAMLFYLDNFTSMAAETPADNAKAVKARRLYEARMDMMADDTTTAAKAMKKQQQARKARGLNENYAREVMELHTLGVDGGYTQKDVTEAARVLTGWTVIPMTDYGNGNVVKKQLERFSEEKLQKQGYVVDGDFLFAANRHDKNNKNVLGKTFRGEGSRRVWTC